MRAELAWREGDYAESGRGSRERCLTPSATPRRRGGSRCAPRSRPAWPGPRCSGRGTGTGAAELLEEGLDDAAAWTEHPSLATVLDASAAYLLARGRAGAERGADAERATDAERAARLLGAAHAVRGAFDESSPDAPAARDAARAALGPRAYLAAYAWASRGLGYEQAAALGRELLTAA